MRKFLILIVPALLACVKGPVFDRNEVNLPSKFSSSADITQQKPEEKWWLSYNDPLLTELIELAANQNYGLKNTYLKIEESRLMTREAIWDLYGPPISLNASYNYSQTSLAKMPFIREDRYRITDYYDAGATTSWEFDLFGASAEAIKGSRAAEVIAAAQMRNAYVSISSEVADNYFALVNAGLRAGLNRKKISNLKKIKSIAEVKYETGMINKTQLLKADNDLLNARAYQQQLRAERRGYYNALKTICAGIPRKTRQRLLTQNSVNIYKGPLSIGNPAEWMNNRPDIIAAENNIKVQSAEVAIAIQDLLPQFTFRGNFGYSAINLSDMGNQESEAYSIGPQISWAFLDLPRFIMRKKIAGKKYEQAVLEYKDTIQLALKELDNALKRFSSEKNRYKFLSRTYKNQEEMYQISGANYSAGRISEEQLMIAENQLLDSNEQQLNTLLALNQGINFVYKALGGGWE